MLMYIVGVPHVLAYFTMIVLLLRRIFSDLHLTSSGIPGGKLMSAPPTQALSLGVFVSHWHERSSQHFLDRI